MDLEKVYYLIGFLIVSNLGAIGTMFLFGFRIVWWASKVDNRLAVTEKVADHAHIRIDALAK